MGTAQNDVRRAVAVGVATLIVALVWRVTFLSWVPNTTYRYDIAEPFLHPWTGLTWTTQVVLWLAMLIRPWPWIPLVAIGLSAVAIQVWIGIGSAWIGVQDGHVSPLGALMGALSIVQIGLTVAWILLIVRSKKMQP